MDLDRFRPAFAHDDTVRFCGLRLETLRRAIQDPKVIDALIDALNVPGKPAHLKALTPDQKLAAIEHQVEVLRATKTSEWYGVEAPEILAASIWNAPKLTDRTVEQLFCSVKREQDLLAPVVAWLRAKGLDAFEEVPLGRCRVDVLGHREGGFLRTRRAVAVELKDEHEQFKRGLDQMATYRDYCHTVFMACTPSMVADQLVRHSEGRGVKQWDRDVFYRRLKDLGFGLLVLEGATVYEFIEPRENRPTDGKFEELVGSLKGAKRV